MTSLELRCATWNSAPRHFPTSTNSSVASLSTPIALAPRVSSQSLVATRSSSFYGSDRLSSRPACHVVGRKARRAVRPVAAVGGGGSGENDADGSARRKKDESIQLYSRIESAIPLTLPHSHPSLSPITGSMVLRPPSAGDSSGALHKKGPSLRVNSKITSFFSSLSPSLSSRITESGGAPPLQATAVGAWVLRPPAPLQATAVVHFIGGAFVGASPQLTYRLFLTTLAQRGLMVVATPYASGFDHLRIADEAQFRFDRCMRSLSLKAQPPNDPMDLPVYGVGHSMGALVHLLIGARYAVERAGNVFLSFNNKEASAAIPLFSPVIMPMAQSLGPILTQLLNNPTLKLGADVAVKQLRDLNAPMVAQLLPLLEQLPPLYRDLSDGRDQFTPAPAETRRLAQTYYGVRRNLLVRFKDDTIDETADLADTLAAGSAVSACLDLAMRTLPGDHVRPLRQVVPEIPQTVADVVSRGSSLLASMTAGTPLADLARGVSDTLTGAVGLGGEGEGGAGGMGGGMGRMQRDVREDMEQLVDELTPFLGAATRPSTESPRFDADVSASLPKAGIDIVETVRDRGISKAVDVPYFDLPERVIRSATDWLATQGSKDLAAVAALLIHDAALSLLAILLRVRPATLQQVPDALLPPIKDKQRPSSAQQLPTKDGASAGSQVAEGDRLAILAWIYGQAARADRVAGMSLFIHCLLPPAIHPTASPASTHLALTFLEEVVLENRRKAYAELHRGAVRGGLRLVPPEALQSFLLAAFPAKGDCTEVCWGWVVRWVVGARTHAHRVRDGLRLVLPEALRSFLLAAFHPCQGRLHPAHPTLRPRAFDSEADGAHESRPSGNSSEGHSWVSPALTIPLPCPHPLQFTPRFAHAYLIVKQLALVKGTLTGDAGDSDAASQASLARAKSSQEAAEKLLPLMFDAAREGEGKGEGAKRGNERREERDRKFPCWTGMGVTRSEEAREEAGAIMVWCLIENPACYSQWERLHSGAVDTSRHMLGGMERRWEELKLQLAPYALLRAFLHAIRCQHAQALRSLDQSQVEERATIRPADIEEDEWWNRPVGSDDEVEEWHAGDSDNDGGKDAHGNNAEAAADAQEAAVDANEEADDEAGAELETFAPADAAAVADAEGEEGGDDDPWSFGTDDDVPLLKRRLRHRLQSKSKRARVVLSDDDGPGEERRPILTAAEKGKVKVAEAPAKAPAKAPARRRTSNKKLTSDGDPGSSKGAAKKKAKKAPNPDDIVVNEPLGSDDEYAAAAGPIPTFPEKASAPRGDNTRLLGRAPEEEEEEEEAMQAEGVREVAVATGLEVLYQETPNYRGAAAEADRMIEPRETARHAWRVPDLGVEPDVSAGEEAVTEGG
ncbi:unnamed protein product [Closterium sp. NIES-64]|nr:unnamed protein product [Closterium sp. NIES-64]